MHQIESDTVTPVLVELTRGDLVEVRHRGYACVVNSEGEVIYAKGDPDFKTYLRSAAKPFQAAAVILSGAAARFNLEDREIAILAGSHGGESFHTQLVAKILAKGGLTLANLQCGTHPPLDDVARHNLVRNGEKATTLHHNCSGKHAGMLLTALHNETSIENYLDPEQPGQRLVKKVIAETAGVDEGEIVVAIDGCSAPVHGISIKAIARLFARLIRPVGLDQELAAALTRVALAMRKYPEMVAGSRGRICTEIMKIGLDCEVTGKAGAEGVYGVGWFDAKSSVGLGLAVKMEDGQQRGRDPVTLKILQKFGVMPEELPEDLKPMAAEKLTNWQGKIIGNTIVTV